MADGMTADVGRAIEWDCAALINRYASLNDEALWEEVAALYAEDGSMTRPTAPDAPIVGREAILAAFESRPPRTTRHITANIVVTVIDAGQCQRDQRDAAVHRRRRAAACRGLRGQVPACARRGLALPVAARIADLLTGSPNI